MADGRRQTLHREQVTHHPHGIIRTGLIFSGINLFEMFNAGMLSNVFVANETMEALEHSSTPGIIVEDCIKLQRLRNRIQDQLDPHWRSNPYGVHFYYRTPHDFESIETDPDIIGYEPRTDSFVMKDMSKRKVSNPGGNPYYAT